ncbi:hypothetical protein CsSME_00018704 [Camellia sinensis var. sinensis]
MDAVKITGDIYRSFLHDEETQKNTHWRYGGPPTYDIVNQLFEQGRTKEWPKGSLEETVQNAIKSWDMERREGISAEEVLRLGTYNALLKDDLPEEFKYYKAEEESFESSHDVFLSVFPRGFAWEVISVHSGPPLIAFKFRHWGFFEGPYKGHAPTGEMVEFCGMGLLKVDESLKAEYVELYFDAVGLFSGLLKGPATFESQPEQLESSTRCPFQK